MYFSTTGVLHLPEHVNYKPHCNPETSHCTEHRWWPIQPDHHTGSIVLVYRHETWSVKKKRGWSAEATNALWVTVYTWGSKTHTCPSGAYVEPVMVNSLREQLFPFAWSTMNICNKKNIKIKQNLYQQGAEQSATEHVWCLKTSLLHLTWINQHYRCKHFIWHSLTSEPEFRGALKPLQNSWNISKWALRIFLSTRGQSNPPRFVKKEKRIKEMRASGRVKWNSAPAVVLNPADNSRKMKTDVCVCVCVCGWERTRQAFISKALSTAAAWLAEKNISKLSDTEKQGKCDWKLN